MHADRTNRTALTLLGLLLLAAGAGAMLASTGVLHAVLKTKTTLKNKTLFDNAISRYIGAHGSWLWAAVAAVCAVLAVLALLWLKALLLSTDRAGDLAVPGDRSHGVTVITASAITTALVAEVQTYRGVESAKARILGDSHDPDVVLTVTTTRSADLARLRAHIETDALTHLRGALDNPALPVQLDLRVSDTAGSRTS